MSETYKWAKRLYTVYTEAVGGTAFNGEPLPDAETFFADETKAKQVKGWVAVANELFATEPEKVK